ncbi:hypothetical protein NEILACOT_05518 [Neisseria lactamica ATCC 23970]|uniref:Uncharacterized protein n=1 Tax=Neisseria lactamica ATCC 23970 TaxID=546265 RepID=D0WD82_NEILA|nr:hypothetical protein NEILACOT_05518 [Neisseria lactamica ATCC 23970]
MYRVWGDVSTHRVAPDARLCAPGRSAAVNFRVFSASGGTGGTLSINRNTVYNGRLFDHTPERNNVSTHRTTHKASPYVLP